MKQIKDQTEVKGNLKKLTLYDLEGLAILSFGDGQYAVLKAQTDYDGYTTIILTERAIDAYAKYQAELLDKDEFDELITEEVAESARLQERRERRQLTRLLEKYKENSE